MAITAVTIEQDNKVNRADLMAVHSPLVFKVLATHDGTAPDNLKATIVKETQDCSVQLDGANEYISTDLPASALGITFTLMCWMKRDDSGDTVVMSCLSSGGLYGIELGCFGDWYPKVTIGSGSSTTDLISGTAMAVSTWTHVAVTYSAATVTLYVNGISVGAGALTMSAGSGVLYLGRRYYETGYTWDGIFDEMRVYNTALTAAEISTAMSTALKGNETGLLAGWNFNQGTPGVANDVTTYYDCSGNGYHGTTQGVSSAVQIGYFGTTAEVLASYYCIPVDDPSTTQRRFALQASNLLKSEMDSFDDVILDSVNTPTLISGRVKKLALAFHDPAKVYNADPRDQMGICAAHAAREFGENPCMTDQFGNTTNTTVYGCIGFYAYVNMYNDTAASNVTLKQLTPTATSGVTVYDTEAGYYSAKVLVTDAVQTFGWYKNSELVKTVTVKGVLGSCVGSQMLKFLDRDGLYRIYPFSRYYTKSTSPSQIGSVNKFLNSILTDQSNVSNIGYTANREVILKQYVDYQELDFIESLYESPRVYYYVGDGSSDTSTDWLEVTVKARGNIYRGKNLTGTEEITVTLPKHYTQTML